MSMLIEPASIHTCVTSPPYFGLRDYGHPEQIGLEQTPGQYIAAMVDVFREVRRVLRDDGTLWLNIGDSYAGARAGARAGPQGLSGQMADRSVAAARCREASPEAIARGKRDARRWGGGNLPHGDGIKSKDLIGIPWMLAFALRADGWYLRQDIIWSKPNPMPESVTDRCSKAHEHIFLLAKSPRYYFDHEIIKEPMAASSLFRLSQNVAAQTGSDRVPGKTNGPMRAVGNIVPGSDADRLGLRSKRDVWTVTTKPYKGAHFATFPPDLIEPCVLAGCPVGGTVLDPFGGSGTTALVAQRSGRNAVLCELNPEYVALAQERLARG